MKTRPANFGFAVDESIFGQEGFAYVDTSNLGSKMQRGFSFVIENIHTTIVVQEKLMECVVTQKHFIIKGEKELSLLQFAILCYAN